jgi:hypothetical protein
MQFTFGKHKGKLITDVIAADINYIKWIINSSIVIKDKQIVLEIEHARTVAQPLLAQLEQQELELQSLRRPLLEPAIKAIQAMLIVNKLKHGKQATDWFMSVFAAINQGAKISTYAQELMVDICSKSQGRRNSKKYTSMKNIIEQSFNEAYNLSCKQ